MPNTIRTIVVIMFLMCANCLAAQHHHRSALLERADAEAMNKWVETKFNAMSQRQKVAQLIVLTVSPADNEATRKLLSHYVEDLGIGGLLFSEGTSQETARLINYSQSLAIVPLMITIDGEWGVSMRMSDAPKFPRNMILGAITDDRLLYDYGKEVARECRLMGIHVNFAPVLDVNDNPLNPVIGTRSFGEVPERVASLGIAYARGMEDNGVLTTAKHFPGHGSTSTDSHKTLPQISKSLREMNMCELLPFRHYAEAGLSGIMVGHLAATKVDASGLPASLSPSTNALLKQIGFNGLVFTDALEMSGASSSGSLAVKALRAGNDVLLSIPNVEKEIDFVLNAVADNKLSQTLIDEKCKKVLRYKYALGLASATPVDEQNVSSSLNSAEPTSLLNRLWAAAITVVKNKSHELPIKHLEENRIAVVTLGDEKGTGTMFQRRCAMYAATTRFSYNSGDNLHKLEAELRKGNFSKVIVAVHSDAAAYSFALASLVNNVENASAAMFINPYKIQKFAYSIKQCKSVVVAYDNDTRAQDFAAQTIFGGNAARGTLPVSIENVAQAGTGISFDATRLGYTSPEEVGLCSDMLSRIDSVAHLGLKQKAFSALQVLVARHGKVVCNKSYGYTDFSKNRQPVDENTMFDLASVSKATGTLSGIMKCYDQGRLSLTDKASRYIDELRGTDKEDITIQDLLLHETGMPASLNMYYVMTDRRSYRGALLTKRRTRNNTVKIHSTLYGNKTARLRSDFVSKSQSEQFSLPVARNLFASQSLPDTVMKRIYNVKLRPNRKCLYSCLNFCILGEVEKRITKQSLSSFVDHYFFAPLGAAHTAYNPIGKFDVNNIVATEYDSFMRKQTLKGYVHDELAAFLGGDAGNAGLFSTAGDVAKLCQMWLNDGTYGGIRFLKPSTVQTFMQTSSQNSRRALGFDRPDTQRPNISPCCKAAPQIVVGHTGFTGTCFWVDKENDLIYIFLSNRVHPSRDNRAFKTLNARKTIQSIIYQSIVQPSSQTSSSL
ncbi:MAG: glycoside hydrolase family 3 N-terminal domain-containing protein [Muribaculaceae bacterium]